MMSRLIFTLVLPPLLWLLCGWPPLNLSGNLALLGVMLAHTYVVVWQGPLFKLMRGDEFTYSAVTFGLNIMSLLVTVGTTMGMFFVYGGNIAQVNDIAKPVWGIIGVSLLLTVALPLLAGGAASALPKASDRRSYEDPTDGQ
ncbi:hypothetical protein FJY94_07825 [Candidatus Kaiserbacteria bacterium]|nr:hypothetical protein [Candidatus Kaiserbacteria bacterium]